MIQKFLSVKISKKAVPRELPKDQLVEEENAPCYDPLQYYPVEAGQVLGNRYVVILKLGHGASSTVWLARDRKKYVPMSMEVAWDAASADKAC